MYKFICLDCGHVFEECDVAVWTESRGEYWGTPCREEVRGCPRCRGSYTKTYECDCCGHAIVGVYVKLESGERICENCYTEYEIGEDDE
jgi:transcription elongation factor Elf1